jgi:hypothetical protein
VVVLKIQVFWNMMLCIGHEFLFFQRTVVPSSLGVKQSSSLGLLGPEGEDTAVLCNTRNTWPSDSVTSQKTWILINFVSCMVWSLLHWPYICELCVPSSKQARRGAVPMLNSSAVRGWVVSTTTQLVNPGKETQCPLYQLIYMPFYE